MQPHIDYLFHKFAKSLHIVNTLGLYKINAGFHLFGKPVDPVMKWIGKGVRCRPDKHLEVALYLLPTNDLMFIPHGFNHMNHLNGVYIKDILGLRVISKTLVIARKAEHIFDSQGRCAKEVRHHREPIAIPGYHLYGGLQSCVDQYLAGDDR